MGVSTGNQLRIRIGSSFRINFRGNAILLRLGQFPGIHHQLEIWLINRVECHPINLRLLLLPRQTLFRTRFLAQLILSQFLFSQIFVQRNSVLIDLMTQTIHVPHHVVELGIVLNALFRASPELINKQGMAIGPFRVFRLGHFFIWQGVF